MNGKSKILPGSWAEVRLADFVTSEKGKKPLREASQPDGTFCIPYIDIDAFENGVFKSWTDGEDCRKCTEDDFIMVQDGSRSGLVGRGKNGALGSTLVRLRFSEICNPYAYYFLQSKFLDLNARARGSGTPHVNPDIPWDYRFPIPPLSEQFRIVAKIEELFSELDKGIENLDATRAQLKVYRQPILKYALLER